MQNTRIDNTVAGHGPCRETRGTGFTLLEVMTALAILALVSSSVLVVIDRCLESTADSTLRMEAFQLARENMEKILSSNTVEETVDYGRSEKYPDVSWQTVVEAFAEPVSGKMWIRAVCSADYTDSTGQEQTVKLEHWITELTDQQANQLAGQPGSIEELTAEQLLATPEEAAVYAGVDAETIQKWVDGGLVTMKDGDFIKYNLDVYMRSDGKPTSAEKKQQVKSMEDLAATLKSQQESGEGTTDQVRSPDGKDRLTGVPQEQLDKMGVGDVMKVLKDKKKK
jgi:prepilin-type N-terminal cleavage/methylation domain-containing protein